MRFLTCVYLIILDMFLGIVLLMYLIGGAMLAVAMSFDSGVTFTAILFDLAIVILPMAAFITPAIFSWRAFARQQHGKAWAWSLINWLMLIALYCLVTGVTPWLLVSQGLISLSHAMHATGQVHQSFVYHSVSETLYSAS